MTAQQILKADLLDILFENRNKEYGAYTLRRAYPSHLKKAIGLMLLLVFVLFLYSMSKPQKSIDGVPIDKDTTDVVLEDIKDQTIKKPEQPQQPRTVEKAPPTRANPVYKILSDDKVIEQLPDANDTSDMFIGPINSPGTVGDGYVAGAPGPQTAIINNVVAEETAEPEIYDPSAINVQPEFPGGVDAWLAYLQKMLRVPHDLEEGERKTVKVKFVVNTEGEISDAVILQSAGTSFDKEVLRVINRMPKWKPGKIKGKPVAVYFTQPVTFVGEE